MRTAPVPATPVDRATDQSAKTPAGAPARAMLVLAIICRRMFVYSLVVFSLASLLVGAAQTPWWLIAARALQGVGAAVLAPSALSMRSWRTAS